MAKEIERKFLVDEDKWEKVKPLNYEIYQQGYLCIKDDLIIRIRQTPQKSFLTIKSANKGFSRDEYEYEIPENDASEMLRYLTGNKIVKKRYKINFSGKLWEVDEFLEENSGLILAEIELKFEDEKFDIPDWISNEVTGDERYYNTFLSECPYVKWQK